MRRFDVSAVYPKFKKPGSYTQVPYCKTATSETARRLGPGTYDPRTGDFNPFVLERVASTPGWKRAEETERLTVMPHVLYKETWERNRLLKQNMGPGRYNINSFLELTEKKPASLRGVCGTKDVRFKDDIKNCTPGPGTYGKAGNPYTLIEERASKSASSKVIMDSETIKCSSESSNECVPGPGAYNLKCSIDETLKHVVGKRGPYDLFSGSRSQNILYGHFATPQCYQKELGYCDAKSFIEVLESDQKKKHGKFGKIHRFPKVPTDRIFYSSLAHCPRPLNSPGPGSYDVKPVFASVRQSSAPFLTSAKRFDRKSCRVLFGSDSPVGVGRYDINKPTSGKTATCYRSAFLSKTGRSSSDQEKEKALKERTQRSHSTLPIQPLEAPANGPIIQSAAA
ncbi:ciliary microtubule-associated protein 2 isoform X2 [Pseudophryne corroboree]|uniref:ciliary microtubule-associated protein 2 isoform X2 n=1 Tax=Pseudophryne corroboree TaxID=495146 RepID=UPI00308218B8